MAETICTRTPEGEPNLCPVCRALICIEPSTPSGDAPCPHCGVLLWFIPTSAGVRFHQTEKSASVRERITQFLSDRFSVRKDQIDPYSSSFTDLGIDSLNVVEFVMELEEEFDVTIPDIEAEGIKTLGDALDRLLRRLP